MNILEAIRKRILKFLKLDHLDYNPDGERLTFICDEENIKRQNLQEFRIWYLGDSNELLNYYNAETAGKAAREPIYNRNRMNYFWAISTTECNIKRVHSGVPNAIITTLVNVIGNPIVTTKDKQTDEMLKNIIEKNDMDNILNQQQMPLTMVEGWGAFKINIKKNLSDVPLIQFYEAENCEFVYDSGVLIGIIFKTYYRYKDKNYVLLETRRKAEGNSYIEYELFQLKPANEVSPCDISTIPELADLENLVIEGYDKILGVACKFLFDPLNKNYGRSLFAGKIDLFDDLDQSLSQNSQTVKVSTPVEYYPVDLLERDRYGNTILPAAYNRQFIKKTSAPNGDGSQDTTIQTTQPMLDFDKYSENSKHTLLMILTGILSPATMGIDIAKKDNAEAQREKEKVTIMTRDNIIKREIKILNTLYSLCLDVQEYMQTGKMSKDSDYGISINFNEFANPSFENELQVLGPAWSNGEMSTERYVRLLWGNKLSEEDIQKEIEWLDNQKNTDDLTMGDFEDVPKINRDLRTEEEDDSSAESNGD